jgi:putative ABC transport system permease protein
MILLAMGGAMFMTALNLSLAWNKTLSQIYVQRLYDQEIRLNERIETDSLFSDIRAIEGVKAVEGWDLITTSIATESEYEITGTYPDGGHGSFVMTAVPLPTALLNPGVVEGSWLKTEGSDEVVLNQGARGPGRGIGDKIVLSIDGAPTRWTIIGFTEDVGSPSTAYVSLKTFSKHVGSNGRVGMFRVAYDNRSHDYVSEKSREVDKILEARKIDVGASIPVWLLRNAVAAHMKVLINSLIAMAIMMAFVGTVGLTSTVSMNVLERTREIGVMRAIGATPKKITTLIVLEGCIVGMLSMLFAFGLSLAGSYYLGGFLGHLTFRIPLTLTISLLGIIVWIAIVLTSCIFATIFPARAANRVTTREALAYE